MNFDHAWNTEEIASYLEKQTSEPVSQDITKDQASAIIDDVSELVGTGAFEDVSALDLVLAFKQVLSGVVYKPVQVSQPVAVYSLQYGHQLETENSELKLRVAELEAQLEASQEDRGHT